MMLQLQPAESLVDIYFIYKYAKPLGNQERKVGSGSEFENYQCSEALYIFVTS